MTTVEHGGQEGQLRSMGAIEIARTSSVASKSQTKAIICFEPEEAGPCGNYVELS